MLWRVTRNGALFGERRIEAIVPSPRQPASLVDVLLRLESGDQRLDALFLGVDGSGSLRLPGIARCAGKIACCRLDAGLSQTSVHSLWKSFGDLFENLHRFTALFLILQLSTVRI